MSNRLFGSVRPVVLVCLMAAYTLITSQEGGAQEGGVQVELDPATGLPEHRWVVTEQKTIVRDEDIGEPKGTSVVASGLIFAANGDLLLATGIDGKYTVLLRSSDRGHTWTRQGLFLCRGTMDVKILLRIKNILRLSKLLFGDEYTFSHFLLLRATWYDSRG